MACLIITLTKLPRLVSTFSCLCEAAFAVGHKQ